MQLRAALVKVDQGLILGYQVALVVFGWVGGWGLGVAGRGATVGCWADRERTPDGYCTPRCQTDLHLPR
jgi:hypothetical protein